MHNALLTGNSKWRVFAAFLAKKMPLWIVRVPGRDSSHKPSPVGRLSRSSKAGYFYSEMHSLHLDQIRPDNTARQYFAEKQDDKKVLSHYRFDRYIRAFIILRPKGRRIEPEGI